MKMIEILKVTSKSDEIKKSKLKNLQTYYLVENISKTNISIKNWEKYGSSIVSYQLTEKMRFLISCVLTPLRISL